MNILEWREVWVDIDESITWPSQHKYQISNYWTLRAYTRKWWRYPKPNIDSQWYPYMVFKKNPIQSKFKYSRIVSWAFLWLDIYNRNIFVCHIDDNPLNSRLDNLFLWDAELNAIDKVIKWRHRFWSKLTKDEVDNIRKLISSGEKINDIAAQYCVSRGAVSDIKHKNTRNF